MTYLATLVSGLKRQVAVPGEFATSFPNTLDVDLIGSLADAFAQAQMDGFFGSQLYDSNTNAVTPDLSPGGSAIIALYAAESVLSAKLRNVPTKTVYKAGNVEYAVDLSANVMALELKNMRNRREQLLTQALRMLRASTPAIYMNDAYVTRSFGFLPFFSGIDMNSFGFWAYELTGPW